MVKGGALFGGNANNGANAGFGYLNANNRSSNSNANIGFRFYRGFNFTKYNCVHHDPTTQGLSPSEYGWIIRCSEEHSKFILNKCLENGNKCIDYRAVG